MLTGHSSTVKWQTASQLGLDKIDPGPARRIIGFSEVLSERMFGELNEKQEE